MLGPGQNWWPEVLWWRGPAASESVGELREGTLTLWTSFFRTSKTPVLWAPRPFGPGRALAYTPHLTTLGNTSEGDSQGGNAVCLQLHRNGVSLDEPSLMSPWRTSCFQPF